VKTRRFVAPTMREALFQIRRELGPDAAILAQRPLAQGVEVTVALDYRPEPEPERNAPPRPVSAPVPAPAQAASPAPAAAPAPAARVAWPAPPPPRPDSPFGAALLRVADARAQNGRSAVAAPRSDPARATAAAARGLRVVRSQDPGLLTMRREVRVLRQLLERQFASLAWDDLARRQPLHAAVLRDFETMHFAPDVARALVARIPADTRSRYSFGIATALLAKNMPVAGSDRLLEGGCWALVGPTGAGKTTTVAKLAARWVDAHGPDSVGIIGIDGYRVGAREQLRAHARLLGVKMRVAATPRDLGKALESMQGRRLVLIDTAGLGQRDLRMGEQQALMASAPGRFGTLLVLPATAELAVLDEIVRAHAALAPAGCILTKVDESPGLAPALSAVMRASLELFYMCDGQRGPENLHFAGAKRPWLVWQATKPRHRAAAVHAPEPVANAL
jgi:flagellar biosynthesis protein FlhF